MTSPFILSSLQHLFLDWRPGRVSWGLLTVVHMFRSSVHAADRLAAAISAVQSISSAQTHI